MQNYKTDIQKNNKYTFNNDDSVKRNGFKELFSISRYNINENAMEKDDDITTYLYHREDRHGIDSHNHMIYCIAGDDGQQIERRDTAMEVQSSSQRIARKVVERESPACGANKGVVGGDGCAMRCIIMMSLLGTRRHFSFPRESRYLGARCHWFARPLGKIVRLNEPSSSLSPDSYKSQMGTRFSELSL